MTDNLRPRAACPAIRYANCWEDADVICAALRSAPGHRILSIASAGDNALALLATGAEVVAADINPAQLACVEFRREAIRRLDQPDCLALLGIRPATGESRLATYRAISRGLSDEARACWDAQPQAIATGIVHHGKFERYFHLFRRWVMPLIHRRRTITELLQDRPREARLDFYARRWDGWRWRWLFRLFFSRAVMGRLGRDREFFRHVQGPVATHILERTRYALSELATHDNPHLEYILTGNFTAALPRYLRPGTYQQVKANLARLVLHHGPIQEAARAQAGPGFDGFNLSDLFEYLDAPACQTVYRGLLEHARPGARLAYWNMLVPRSCPPEFAGQVRPLTPLAEQLFASDKAFFYGRFIIEEVVSQ